MVEISVRWEEIVTNVAHSLIRFTWRYNPYRMQMDKSWTEGMRVANEDTTNKKKTTIKRSPTVQLNINKI